MIKKFFLLLLSIMFVCILHGQNTKPTISNLTPNNNTLFAVSQNKIIKSINGGSTWTTVYTGLESQSFKSISFINNTIGFVFGYSDSEKKGGVLKTVDGGNTWIDQYSNLPTIAANKNFSCSTKQLSDYIYVGGNENIILKYTVSNNTWSAVLTGVVNNWITGLYALNSNGVVGTKYVAQSYLNNLIKTTNGGTNWQNSSMPGLVDDIYFHNVTFNGSTGFIISGQSDDISKRLFKSVDNGQTWTVISTVVFSTHSMLTVSFPTPSNIFIFGSDLYAVSGKFWKSLDSGASWIDLSSNLPQSINSIWSSVFIDGNTGWLGTDDGQILYTEDGGLNWTIFSTPVSNGISDIYLIRF